MQPGIRKKTDQVMKATRLVGHRLEYCDGVMAKPRCTQVGAHHMRVAKVAIDLVHEGVNIYTQKSGLIYKHVKNVNIATPSGLKKRYIRPGLLYFGKRLD